MNASETMQLTFVGRFHPPIFMRILEYRIKKMLDVNAKMCINSKNARKKLVRTFLLFIQ